MTSSAPDTVTVAIIGGGPAGLMAAETLAQRGIAVDVFDAMPSVGRKFLMAGKGGMNLTHSEAADAFVARYGSRAPDVAPWLAAFGPQALRDWAQALGVDTFVGSSGRVFPTDMKAAPLLRAWMHRLRGLGVRFHMRHRWQGWVAGQPEVLRLETPQGERHIQARAVVLALGGGSWPRLGSDGAWLPWLAARGIAVAPLQPANCGFELPWSEHFRSRYAGQPVKAIALGLRHEQGAIDWRRGEFIATDEGIEGGLVYALSAPIRDRLAQGEDAGLWLDLLPTVPAERVLAEVTRPRGARSMSSHLQSRLGLTGVRAGLLREALSREAQADPYQLAAAIKALPLHPTRPRPIAEVISSAGGVTFEALDTQQMLRALPGVFCAGEMLDWEAPTGGYLLTACFASGVMAGRGVQAYLEGAG